MRPKQNFLLLKLLASKGKETPSINVDVRVSKVLADHDDLLPNTIKIYRIVASSNARY